MDKMRRNLIATGLVSPLAISAVRPAGAQAGKGAGASNDDSRELSGIFAAADEMQVGGPRAAGPNQDLSLAQIVLALLERPQDENAANLATRAGLLLGEHTRRLRDGADAVPSDIEAAAPPKYQLSTLADSYIQLFRSAKINPGAESELSRVAAFINSPSARERYKEVEAATTVPWYIVGALHYREASLNFMGHLHNGDPLLMQTVHVPARRPPQPWLPDAVREPKELWRRSAVDALQPLKLKVPNWTIAGMCYGFELYNGFGCRDHRINSPYLWNYTNHYTSGGFPRDHVFDPRYRSRQAGLVAIIVTLARDNPEINIKA